MYIGIARGGEPISHPAQRTAVDELILIDGGDGPAVVSRNRNTAAIGRVRVHRQRGERPQRCSAEKFHSSLSFTAFVVAQTYQMILPRAIAAANRRSSNLHQSESGYPPMSPRPRCCIFCTSGK